jgi:predicted HNH restriction endonuclease
MPATATLDHARYDIARALCEELAEIVTNAHSVVTRRPSPGSCVLTVPNNRGKNVGFAYIYHRTNHIQVYLMSRLDDELQLQQLASTSGIQLIKRKTLGSDWAKQTPFYIELNSLEQAAAALPLLSFATARNKPRSRLYSSFVSPTEEGLSYDEGNVLSVQVNRYERDPRARAACIKFYGAMCVVCAFDFGQRYGDIGGGFIHIHHLIPISRRGKDYKLDPRKDLRPVCPNCHEMLHKGPPFTIDELKNRLHG